MARYTCSFTIAVPSERLRLLLDDLLEACGLNIIYDQADYIMAREIPGAVFFTKLVTVVLMIQRSTASDSEFKMNLEMKNAELPLNNDNHCNQMFHLVKQAIEENRHWQLLESIVD